MAEIVNTILIPVVVGIIIGLVLLIVEYRTHWFANRFSKSNIGIKAHDLSSRKGNISAKDSTGQGIDATHLDADKDITLINEHLPDLTKVSPDELVNAAEQMLNTLGITAQKVFAGGNITIQQFLNNQLPLTQQIEFFNRQIGLPYSRSRNYENSQYETYCNMWKILQSLRLAGDDLWSRTNHENLIRFADELRKTKLAVNEGEIFFEEEDRKELLVLLHIFGDYRLGKLKIVQIHSEKDIRLLDTEQEIQNQIERNRRHKEKYEKLLETIRVSFRKRLLANQGNQI